ncbi:response regulator transcription factor [Roseateles asaccharophilus]|uniref:DNA-binding NarL/FixJ family response regulator n=1 Tax=Roseateles asaccharophilus TaxID=582607 RepID=A0ABU2ABJ5_9BURK|nr:response regulator transcription factor [Roseateles asaccharophilus]MDR7334579.1 DNA-binding NarL/FixJ family response regulator [Roseateles asaccharophilus]
MTLRLVLADDHQLVREGLRALLSRDSRVEVVGVAADGATAVKLVRQLQPDILVTDIAMPGLNGIEATRRVRAQAETQVICLSMHGDQRSVVTALQAGASGFVLKDASCDELLGAVREVATGGIYISPGTMGGLVEEIRDRQRLQAALPGPVLTAKEREILQLFAEDLSTQEIADRLKVSAKTVATHREHVTRKLGVRGIAGMTRYALSEGLTAGGLACR